MTSHTNETLIKKVSATFNVHSEKIQIKTVEESETAICVFLDIEISEDHTKKIFIKLGKQNFLNNEFRHEIEFYQIIKEMNLLLSVPNCHLAEFDDQTGQGIIILDDYSDSYKPLTEWPIPPQINDCKRAISALADFHAKFWNHPTLGVSFGSSPNKSEMESDTAEAIACLDEFISFLGDRINEKTIEIYKRAISAQYWWPHFERAPLAYMDLNCDELIRAS